MRLQGGLRAVAVGLRNALTLLHQVATSELALSPHLSQAVPPLAVGLETQCLAQLLPTRAGHSPDRRFPFRDLPGDVGAHESAVLAQRLLRGPQIQDLQSPAPEPPPPLLSGLLYSKN